MLSTLTKIGEQLLKGKGIWAQLTTEPKYDQKKTNWICPILFDCINQNISILKDEIHRFKPEESIIEYRYISTELWGRRGKKCALTVELKNFSMLEETLFGKGSLENGDMLRSISELPEFKTSLIFRALSEIYNKLNIQRNKLDLAEIKKELNLGNQGEVVLFHSLIKSEVINNGLPINLVSLEGYDDFILKKFGSNESNAEGIDYVNGNFVKKVREANFSGRYNIHKIFQTTASNYASGFTSFRKNFQSSQMTLAALDKSSQYVLNRLQSKIAGVTHIVIPDFLNKDLEQLDIKETELFLERSSDLLFSYNSFDTDLEKELPETNLFWINYLAFESDGNSFKVLNHIKDVNSKYLRKLIEVFDRTGIDFQVYLNSKYSFNLQSVYFIIPVRDGGKSKNNQALLLFKDILEQRIINSELLFKYFIELILCHRYRRYAAFPNIRKNDSYDFAVKDAVFRYLALIHALKQLNLINMEKEEIDHEKSLETKNDFKQRIDNFFDKMEYSENEKAMFYLGRVLSMVAYAQYKKGHESKPVLNKVNFNGMDAQAIVRLSLDLNEKVRQYNIHRETDGNLARFRESFNEKNWSLSNEQSVFYLMAGYSFGLTKSENN